MNTINFSDSSSGILLHNKLKTLQNKKRWNGSVLVRLQGIKDSSVIDFIEIMFEKENIFFSENENRNRTTMIAVNYNIPNKAAIQALLDKCIILNTWMIKYFIPLGCIKKFDIYYQLHSYEDKAELYISNHLESYKGLHEGLTNSLLINEGVYSNTDAKTKMPNLDFSFCSHRKYNHIYAKLAAELNEIIK